jgi:hypothetical protein
MGKSDQELIKQGFSRLSIRRQFLIEANWGDCKDTSPFEKARLGVNPVRCLFPVRGYTMFFQDPRVRKETQD